jgi:hypothetical protein
MRVAHASVDERRFRQGLLLRGRVPLQLIEDVSGLERSDLAWCLRPVVGSRGLAAHRPDGALE